MIFMTAFIFIESKTPEPIVDLKFFKNSVFVSTLVNNFIVFMGMMGAVFLIPVFVQTFLGYDATTTGYLFIPMAVCMVLASPIGGALTGKIQPRYVIFLSTLVAAIGIYFFTFSMDPRATALDIIIPLSIMAFGMGFGMAQRTNVIAAVVPPEEIGSASSVLALGRNIAGSFGIAVFGTILTNATESNVLNIAQQSVIKITDAQIYKQAIGLIILKADIDAYKEVFFWASMVLLVGTALSLLIKVPKEEMINQKKVLIEA
jgi:MFS family permease